LLISYLLVFIFVTNSDEYKVFNQYFKLFLTLTAGTVRGVAGRWYYCTTVGRAPVHQRHHQFLVATLQSTRILHTTNAQ
jgi:hypothetical protein